MRLPHFYTQSVRKERSTKGIGFLKTFLFAGIMMVVTPFISNAMSPVFINGTTQNRTVCDNSPIDIGAWLKVTDLDISETLTWTVVIVNNGTVTGGGATASTPGSTITPSGMIYTPAMGSTNDQIVVQVDDGTNSAFTTIILSINAGPSLTLGAFPQVCKGVTNAVLTFSDLQNVGPDTVILNYTGAMQSWTVPANVTGLKFDLMGASGGHDSYSGSAIVGKGGRIQGNLAVIPNSTLNIYVGGMGGDGTPSGALGGYNGGGNTTFYAYGCGGGGGGATDIRVGGTGLANRRVVAGGGGGNGQDLSAAFAGGAGGGLTGGSGETFNASAARGGTQGIGGAGSVYFPWASGSNGAVGVGGDGSTQGISGGGGAGYYGGGGGAWSAGGGGSSYSDPGYAFSVTHTQGANEGNGVAKIYYVNPGTYDLIWDGPAFAAGFENVASALLPSNYEFNIAVPGGVDAGTYHATLTINNINCNSVAYPVEVTVRALPTVENPGDFVVCHGNPIPDINFVSSLSESDIHWIADDPSGIGLPSTSGTGHIATFMPINTSPLPVSATFTVTPIEVSAAGLCPGTSQVFHIVDNPVPVLNSTTTPAAVCNNTLFSYLPTSLTPGTSFDWTRATTPGIANPGASGSGNPNETLLNTTNDPITVSYVYTLMANGCSNEMTVNVVVNPTPSLTTTTSPSPLCNGDAFVYTPIASSTAATVTWSRPLAAGISNPTASGSGAISETLVNTTTTPKTVHYAIDMTIGTCVYTEDVAVIVNPPMLMTSPSTRNVCDSDLLEYNAISNISVATITWTRPVVAGIANTAGSGVGNIAEHLYNTTVAPVVVNYTYTFTAFGCTVDHNLAVTVKPSPKLTSTLTPTSVCTNTLFTYSASSATTGTTFEWARDTVVGITNPAIHVMSGNVSEILISTADTILSVPYKFTSTANGCPNSQIVLVKVNPLPRISNDSGNLAVCDSVLWSYSPTSFTPGATYVWTRAYQAGISNTPNSGTSGNPGERLNNTTYISVPVTYVYTITANGCSNTQSVTVQVRPSPILTHNTDTVCSGTGFVYSPVSYTTGTQFAWSRTASAGITPPSRSGTGDIADTLTQGTTGIVNVTYDMDLKIFGCVNKQKVFVAVNPAPAVPVIGTHPSATLCNGAGVANFGADAPAQDGYSYSWSATNATIYAAGSSKQFALVTFSTPGTATVTLTTMKIATTCTSKADYIVTVSTVPAQAPDVIYINGEFVCKQTEQTSYQWGYDDATTLDSVAIAGETNQNYFNKFPDFAHRYYWVLTTRAGDNCVQKTYFNKPTGIADMNTVSADMKVFPNPARDFVNVEVNQFVTGKVSFNVYNMVGQLITTVNAKDNSAQISIAELAAGAYIIDCYSDGIKVAAARFIKN